MTRKRKLNKAELLNRAIEHWEQKQEGAVIMLRKSAEELLKLRRRRKRMLMLATARPVETPRPRAHVRLEHMVEDFPAAVKEAREDSEAKPTLSQSCDHIASAMIQGKSFEAASKDDGIPDFLRRKKEGEAKDAEFKAKVAAEQAERKDTKKKHAKEKRKITKEVRDAELTGKRRAMPLTGKEALEAIYNDSLPPRLQK
jgi:hypothetical protein